MRRLPIFTRAPEGALRLLLATFLTLLGCDDAPEQDPVADAGVPKDASRDAVAPPLDAAKLDAALVVDARAAPVEDASPVPVVDAATIDSAVQDAGSDASMCVKTTERCDDGLCCAGNACVTSSEAAFKLCAKTCTQDTECDSGCCATLPGSGADKVCAPQLHCDDDQPELLPLDVPCITAELIAGDGTYLGKATARFESESVCFANGDYGSFFGEHSIFNKTGSYGGFGQYSAYSTSAFTPPAIKCPNSSFVEAYVGKTTLPQSERVIDPDDLCAVLELSNL